MYDNHYDNGDDNDDDKHDSDEVDWSSIEEVD